jgi:hypothetical protein
MSASNRSVAFKIVQAKRQEHLRGTIRDAGKITTSKGRGFGRFPATLFMGALATLELPGVRLEDV